MVPSKLSVSVLPIAAWWTTTWITVPPKHHSVRLLCNVWWTTTWITVHPKPNTNISRNLIGELLLDLRYFRDSSWLAPECARVNYCLDYCTSEIPVPTDALPARVNYYSDYRTSETRLGELWRACEVNHCLIYGTSETRKSTEARSCLVNYYLDYRTSETKIHQLVEVRSVNYYLVYRTSETRTAQPTAVVWWTTNWFTVPPKPSSSFVPIKLGLN